MNSSHGIGAFSVERWPRGRWIVLAAAGAALVFGVITGLSASWLAGAVVIVFAAILLGGACLGASRSRSGSRHGALLFSASNDAEAPGGSDGGKGSGQTDSGGGHKDPPSFPPAPPPRGRKAKAQEMAQRMDKILRWMSDSFFNLDTQGRITHMNPACEAMFEGPASQFLGRALWEVYPGAEAARGVFEEVLALGRPIHLNQSFGDSGDRSFEVDVYPSGEGVAVFFRETTKRTRAEAALRASKLEAETLLARYRRVLDNSLDVICTLTPDGRFAEVSAASLRVWGYTPEEMADRHSSEFMHPDDAAASEALGAQVTAGEALLNYENRQLHKNGRVVYCTWTAHWSEFDQCVFAVARDTTEQHHASERIAASEDRFRNVCKVTNDAVWEWDLTEDGVWWSDGAPGIFGRRMEEIVRTVTWWLEQIHPEDRERVKRELDEAIAEGSDRWESEYRILRKDGREIRVADRSVIVRDDSGAPIRVCGGMSDITERRHLEAQLLQSQKMEGIGRLAGGIAHDFNNLLTAILGYVGFAKQELPEDSPIREDLEHAEIAANRAADLTRHLLAFARKQVSQPELLDINDLLVTTNKMLRRLIGENIELAILPSPEPALVRLDPGHFDQLMMNLAINARDAIAGEGKITIRVQHAALDPAKGNVPGGLPAGRYVRLSVADTGSGVPEEALPHIFDPFYTTKGVGEGTGLGLSTCYGLMTQAGGAIHAMNQEQGGAVFTLYFPAVAEGGEAVMHRSAAEMPRGGSETILVVEDEPLVRRMVAQTLKSFGYDLLVAESGTEAVAMIRAHEGPLDLVLTDVVMPLMSGRQLAELLRFERPGLRVLYMSGYTDNVFDDGDGDEIEAYYFIAKPFTPGVLAAKVRYLLDLDAD